MIEGSVYQSCARYFCILYKYSTLEIGRAARVLMEEGVFSCPKAIEEVGVWKEQNSAFKTFGLVTYWFTVKRGALCA